MAPSFYLNETCVSYTTQNYTLLLPTSELAETCAIDPFHMSGMQKAILALTILKGILLLLRVGLQSYIWGEQSVIKSLWKTLSHELHDELEYKYRMRFGGTEGTARIKNVTYTTDHATKERVITVVENISQAPKTKGGGEGAKRAKITRSTRAVFGGDTSTNGTGQQGGVRPWNSTADAASSATWPTATNNERQLPVTSALGSTQSTATYVGNTSTTDTVQERRAEGEPESMLSPPPPAYSKHTFRNLV